MAESSRPATVGCGTCGGASHFATVLAPHKGSRRWLSLLGAGSWRSAPTTERSGSGMFGAISSSGSWNGTWTSSSLRWHSARWAATRHRRQRWIGSAMGRTATQRGGNPERPYRPGSGGQLQPGRPNLGHRRRRQDGTAVGRWSAIGGGDPHRPYQPDPGPGVQQRWPYPGQRRSRRHGAGSGIQTSTTC
jgi:hypothetical protein